MEEFWNLPGSGKLRSLVRGEVVEEMPPGGLHGTVAARTITRLQSWSDGGPRGYVGDAVVVFEIDESLRYVSPALERLIGYAPEEPVGFVMLDVIHPEDLERVVAESVEIWDSPGMAPPFVFRLRRKDGS